MDEAPYVHRTLPHRQGKHLRQHAHLQIAGGLQLLLEPEQVGIHLVVQPLPFQAGAEARLQQHLIERLEQVIDRTELDAAYDAGHFVERGGHHDGQVMQAPPILQPAQHLIAVDLGIITSSRTTSKLSLSSRAIACSPSSAIWMSA